MFQHLNATKSDFFREKQVNQELINRMCDADNRAEAAKEYTLEELINRS